MGSKGYSLMYSVLNMRLLKMSLSILLSYLGTAVSQDAVALFGGEYPDGYFDNEVEIWSHSSSCNLEIPSTPDSFRDAPGVGVLDDQIYVCGGHRIGTNHTRSTCDVYSLTDNKWSEGPSLNDQPMYVYMATVGSRLIAAYTVAYGNQLVVSALIPGTTPEWSVLTTINCGNCWYYLGGIGMVDENHIGLVEVFEYGKDDNWVHVVNLETGKDDKVHLPNNSYCSYGFVYNDLFTCTQQVNDGANLEFYSLTYNGEEASQHEWTLIADIPYSNIDQNPNHVVGPYLQLDGKLTSLSFVPVGLIYWMDEMEDGEWKTAEIEIARRNVGWT